MAVSICPTIMSDDPAIYKRQMRQIVSYATRIHIDLSDGLFTGAKLMEIENVWWPGGVRADLHVMYRRPTDHLEALLALQPQLVIIHAEAEGDFMQFADQLHHHGIEAGVALLPETSVQTIIPALPVIDHVMIFSGNLGHFGGQADLHLLDKVTELRQLKPSLEIGWDGGVDDQNISALVRGGIDVLNVGGYLHGAKDPLKAYATLQSAASK